MQLLSRICRRWADRVRRHRRHSASLGRTGAVAIVTAIAAPALVMIAGFAGDYAYASYINQRLSRATDSATTGAVSQTAATTAGGYDKLAALQTIGNNLFSANMADLSQVSANFSLSVVSDGTGGVIATGTYSFSNPTFFGGVLGFNNIPLSGVAKTTARPVVYMSYYILVDNSQSMGIGATQNDMSALYQRVLAKGNANSNDGGCVFACHVKGRLDNQGHYQQYTNEDLAHNLTQYWGPPITLRIDSAVSAVNNIVSSAAQIAATAKNIQFGLYTIETDPNTGLRVSPKKYPASSSPDFSTSSNYAAVQQAVSQITLGNTIANMNTGDSDFHDEFADFLSGIAAPVSQGGTGAAMKQGSGASSTSPLNYIFLITDGLNDVAGSCQPYGLCTSPINSSDCATLKANATLGVIYTTYLPILQNNVGPALEARYQNMVDGKPPLIKTALQACATSSDWYFEAQDGPGLEAAMQALFTRTQPSSDRITQ